MAEDIKKLRDKALAEHGELQKKIDGMKGKANKSDLRALRQQAAVKAEEYGELARMVALQAGGKNYRPPVT